ncbi:GAF domain-containing protein [Candidatus Solirubrobacter pratensis]|uniref:GAF domain-containing protein n=1 Tax=Candidatus Solirubrobacter pratensis TaxID=1298857 RepID=UPI0012DDA444|nr:GAF domain-containing protein [Candidatus Solirubrobacter pratensis]
MTDSWSNLGGLAVGAEDFLAAVLRTIAQPIVVVDKDGVIRFANPASATTLGYDGADELIGRPSHETIHYKRPDGSPYPASECPMLLPRTTGETVAIELDWFFRRDGSMFPVAYVSAALEMPTGRGAVVAFSDIEERQDSNQRLREREAALAHELASLRRVATLATAGAPSAQIFAAIVEEVAHVMHLPLVTAARYDHDGGSMTILAETSDRPHLFRVGTRWPLDGPSMARQVLLTGHATRVEDYTRLSGAIADGARESGIRGLAGAPIVVDGRVWGVMAAASITGEPLPEEVEARLADFTAMVATAISNSQARDELRRLADEQAALRRVATIVAESASPAEVFAAVAGEVARIMRLPIVSMYRYEPDGTATVAAAIGDHPFQPGTNWPLDSPTLPFLVRETGRPATVKNYAEIPGTIGEAAKGAGLHAGVGAPIVVDGRLWGAISAVAIQGGRIPADAGARLNRFTALLATAISNSQAREDLRRLAEEQAALRRLATLVARGVESQEVFDAVCEETGRVLGAACVNLLRFTSDGLVATLAGWSTGSAQLPPGLRMPLDDDVILHTVRDTAAPARSEGDEPRTAGQRLRRAIRSEVAAPVVVEGRVWGALVTGTDEPDPMPPGTEHRLADFTELIATAVANAEARDELLTSRARIVEAADEQRRRVVRDLHDGAQQRLVHTIVTLQLARRELGERLPTVGGMLEDALANAEEATNELRELAHGILPTGLLRGGLQSGLTALASRAAVPVALDVTRERFAMSVEATAYFVVAEALTNVSKHAHAHHARVTVGVDEQALRIEVRDDGVGGAFLSGPGLVGMRDRLSALEGKLRVDSPSGGGTVVTASIPLAP